MLDLCVLGTLTDAEEHGYAIGQRLRAAGLGDVQGGTLYPILARVRALRRPTHPTRRRVVTDPAEYLRSLTEALSRRGLDAQRTNDVVEEVGAHLRDSRQSPEAEFGDPGAFAQALITGDADDGPGSAGEVLDARGAVADESYTFRATALDEMAILDDLGREGWELTGVREFGLIARRPVDVGARRTWRYERRAGVRRQPVLREMTEAGWQPCGRWVTFHYFKQTAR